MTSSGSGSAGVWLPGGDRAGRNGLQVAERILQLAPETKIIFLTQNGDEGVREAAFRIGASGYVLKAKAHGKLLSAIDVALSGPPRLIQPRLKPALA